MRTLIVAAAFSLVTAGAALADPIAGSWRTQSGATAAIAPCGGAFCITLRSGEHAGKGIGSMSPKGGNKYAGTIKDPANGKSYSGSATLAGNTLSMSGCVLGGIICRSQTWTRR